MMSAPIDINNDKHIEWYAMRVFMNKVSLCCDNLSYLNQEIQKSPQSRSNRVSDKLLGDSMEYYAPFKRIEQVNKHGKRVVTEVPIIPSLFFIRCNQHQAEGFEDWMDGKVHLYKCVKDFKVEPLKIPLKQMQMFMMVSSGDQEGLEYFEDSAFCWRKGERVRVIDGRFKGLEGEIKRINGNHRLVVTVEGVCAVATTYIPRCFLEKLE